MKFVKKNKKLVTKPADWSVKYHLHNLIAGSQPGRSIKTIHASDLMKDGYDFCPRQFVIMDVIKKKARDEFLTTAMATTYKLGYLFADHVIDTLADAGMVIGNWKCMHCGQGYEFRTKPTVCEECGHGHFRHIEMRFKSQISGVSCGIDALLKLGSPKLRVLELKTIKGDDFKKLAGPQAEHKWRTNLYMRCIEESGSPWAPRIDLKEATVMYVSKIGYGCKDPEIQQWKLRDGPYSPFKEYLIARDDKKTETKVALATKVEQCRKGTAPGFPEGICPNSFGKRASSCPVVAECFSGKYKGVF